LKKFFYSFTIKLMSFLAVEIERARVIFSNVLPAQSETAAAPEAPIPIEEQDVAPSFTSRKEEKPLGTKQLIDAALAEPSPQNIRRAKRLARLGGRVSGAIVKIVLFNAENYKLAGKKSTLLFAGRTFRSARQPR
jgi:hypothetical protein